MDEITLKNFRCFREEQTARLAPLTLLVGENSTGKTSFLAMIRALWDVAYQRTNLDFKEEPYDLGSFDEIAHHRGGRGGRATNFKAGFAASQRVIQNNQRAEFTTDLSYHFNVTYHIEFGERLFLIENVPARVNFETGEKHFSPETVKRLQQAVWEQCRPVRTIEIPVYEYAALS